MKIAEGLGKLRKVGHETIHGGFDSRQGDVYLEFQMVTIIKILGNLQKRSVRIVS